jgi:hypothetical protein
MRELQAAITFTIASNAVTADAAISQMDDAIMQGNKAMEETIPASSLLEHSADAADHNAIIGGFTSVANTWEPLLDKIALFTKIADQVSEVRYATEYIRPTVLMYVFYLDPSLREDGVEHPECRPQGDLSATINRGINSDYSL